MSAKDLHDRRVPARRLVTERVRGIDLPPVDPLNLRGAELRAAGHHVISLGQALPFFPPPPPAIEAAHRALGRPDVHRYSTDPGLQSLREILAERLGAELGHPVSAADLVVTAGANHAFTLAVTTLVAPGDEVVLPGPYFTNHHMAVQAHGAAAVEAPAADRDGFTIRWRDIEPALSRRTRAVVLCPRLSYGYAREEDLDEALERLAVFFEAAPGGHRV